MKNLFVLGVLVFASAAQADSVNMNNPSGALARILLQPEVQKCLKKYAKEQRSEPVVTQGHVVTKDLTSTTYSIDGGNALMTVTESFVRAEGAMKITYDCTFATY